MGWHSARINDPVYGREIWLLRGDYDGLVKWLDRRRFEASPKSQAKTILLEEAGTIVLWISDLCMSSWIGGLGALAHETQHVTNIVMEHAGIRTHPGSDEPSCYYQAWPFRKALVKLTAWNKTDPYRT